MANDGWTVDSLRIHLEALIGEHDRRVTESVAAHRRECETNSVVIDRRLAAMNELRGVVEDQRAAFLTKDDYALAHQTLVDRCDGLQQMSAGFTTRTEMEAHLAPLINQMETLHIDREREAGRVLWSQRVTTVTLTVAALLVSAVGVAVFIFHK